MPDENESAQPPTTDETESNEAPDKFTEEWYSSVEKRFQDLGEYIRSGKATHGTPAESQGAQTPATSSEGQPTPREEAGGTVGAPAAARDTRPPKPNHFWFRRLGE